MLRIDDEQVIKHLIDVFWQVHILGKFVKLVKVISFNVINIFYLQETNICWINDAEQKRLIISNNYRYEKECRGYFFKKQSCYQLCYFTMPIVHMYKNVNLLIQFYEQ